MFVAGCYGQREANMIPRIERQGCSETLDLSFMYIFSLYKEFKSNESGFPTIRCSGAATA
eukprot:scaffold2318_cov363-Pavlova_lutheri.AAC.7